MLLYQRSQVLFPRMGVILSRSDVRICKILLFPCYGGYSKQLWRSYLQDAGCFPLWGLFYLTKRYRILNASCFPVAGVILDQLLQISLSQRSFPVMGVILFN